MKLQFMADKKPKKPSKSIIALCVSVIVFCLICIGTYAWFQTQDAKLNNLANDQLAAKIVEQFTEPFSMRAGQTVKKAVKIQNTGTADAIIRVSLDEALALFDVDISNGNLAYSSTAGTAMQKDDLSTWVVGNTIPAYKTDASGNEVAVTGQYFTVDSVYKKASVGYLNSDRLAEIANYLTITFGDVGTAQTNTWIYSNGYFYYNQILQPGTTTPVIINNVKAASDLPNTYKGLQYKIDIHMEAVNASENSLAEWWPTAPAPGTDAAYDRLSSIL